jgi:hypothetical protein
MNKIFNKMYVSIKMIEKMMNNNIAKYRMLKLNYFFIFYNSIIITDQYFLLIILTKYTNEC